MTKDYNKGKPRHRQKLARKIQEVLIDFGFTLVSDEISHIHEHYEFDMGNGLFMRVGTRIVSGAMRRVTRCDSIQVYAVSKRLGAVNGLIKSEHVHVEGSVSHICYDLLFQISKMYERLMVGEKCEFCKEVKFVPMFQEGSVCSAFCGKKKQFWKESTVLKRRV